MEFLTPLLGNIGTVVLALILWKAGILKYLLDSKSGQNGNGKLHEIEQDLTELKTNHLEHLQKGIDRLIEMQEEENKLLSKFEILLTDIRENTKHGN